MTAEAAGRATVIRAATAGDAAAIAAAHAPVVRATAISFEEKAPGPAEISRRMLASPRLPWLVAEDGPSASSAMRYKRGAWRDAGWWQRAPGGPPAAPEEPRAWRPAGHVTP